jgi:hypothetical protein
MIKYIYKGGNVSKIRFLLGIILLAFAIFLSSLASSNDEPSLQIISVMLGIVGLILMFGLKNFLDVFLNGDTNSNNEKNTTLSSKKTEEQLRIEYLTYLAEWKTSRDAYDREQSQPLHLRRVLVKQPTETPVSYELWKMGKDLR